MQITKIIYIHFVLLCGVTLSCSSKQNQIENIFNKDEWQTINEIIEFYDNFVLSKVENPSSIENAYSVFLDTNCPLVLDSGHMSYLIPEIKEKRKFYNTLDKDALADVFHIHDTIIRVISKTRERVSKYSPYLSLNSQGKYIDFLKVLSKRNDFFEKYYQIVSLSGDISATNYGLILRDYNKIDFSKKEERLIFIVNILNR